MKGKMLGEVFGMRKRVERMRVWLIWRRVIRGWEVLGSDGERLLVEEVN